MKFYLLYLLSFIFTVTHLSAQKVKGVDFAKEAVSDAGLLQSQIESLKIEGLILNSVQFIDSGTYVPDGSAVKFESLPAFCLVAATLRPTSESLIRIELWMPRNNWNMRLLGTGNGGGGGKIIYDRLAAGVKRNFATVNTDMGTSAGVDSAAYHPERWKDFGFRATHLMTTAAKQIIELYYGRKQSYAYFVGCSTGGQQALMEAQRYPEDYDGIIAGAPANNRTHLHTDFLLHYVLANAPGGVVFSKEDLEFISKKIVSTFAGKDGGAATDSFLTDPRMAKFSLDSLFACNINTRKKCLSSAQIAVLKKIYAGPVNPRDGAQIHASPPAGSENAAGGLSLQQTKNGAQSLLYPFRWALGPDFDYTTFDFDHHQAIVDSILGPLLNANDPDLSKFQNRGGKLMMYTGTADALVPYPDAVNYYERVIKKRGSFKKTMRFFRYFLVPGMSHCTGGPGLNDFGQNLSTSVKQDADHDILTALMKWVEKGDAPQKLIAAAFSCCNVPPALRFERPIYPYPYFPEYKGGDMNNAANYKKAKHARGDVQAPAEKYLK